MPACHNGLLVSSMGQDWFRQKCLGYGGPPFLGSQYCDPYLLPHSFGIAFKMNGPQWTACLAKGQGNKQ